MTKSPISLFFVLISSQLMGEVIATSDHSFQLRYQIESSKDCREAFQVFSEIETWWNSSHTFGGDSKVFRFNQDKQALFEKLESGWVRHMEIVHWDEGNWVVLRGGLGPLQSEAVIGVMTWQFVESASNSSRIVVNYKVHGSLGSSMAEWAKVVDRVLNEQIGRYIEVLSD